MNDLLYIGITIAFFALTFLFLDVCRRVGGDL
jgi:hypothetical protein